MVNYEEYEKLQKVIRLIYDAAGKTSADELLLNEADIILEGLCKEFDDDVEQLHAGDYELIGY